jgi:hypothetical protein
VSGLPARIRPAGVNRADEQVPGAGKGIIRTGAARLAGRYLAVAGRARPSSGPGEARVWGRVTGQTKAGRGRTRAQDRNPDGDRNDPKRTLSTGEKAAQRRPSECCGWVRRGRREWARRSAQGQRNDLAAGHRRRLFHQKHHLNWFFLLENRTRVSNREGLVRCDAGQHDVA